MRGRGKAQSFQVSQLNEELRERHVDAARRPPAARRALDDWLAYASSSRLAPLNRKNWVGGPSALVVEPLGGRPALRQSTRSDAH